MTISPPATSAPEQQITVASGNYTDGSTSYVQVGVGGKAAEAKGELSVIVKQYKKVTIAIHSIIQQSGTGRPIVPQNVPTASQFQTFLNEVYGRQTNTYFYVARIDHAMNFDPLNRGQVNITDFDDGGTQMQNIRENCAAKGYDFEIYFVHSVNAGGDSTGITFWNFDDALVGDNSGGYTELVSAHELGHLLGLLHPEDKNSGNQYDPGSPTYDLMHHNVSGSFLSKLQWDIVNPYDENSL